MGPTTLPPSACHHQPAPVAPNRRGKSHCLGRGEAGDQTGSRAAGDDSAGVPAEDARHHRRPRRRQDDARPQHFGNLHREEAQVRAGRADRQGGKTAGGNNRADGQNDSPAPGVRSGDGRIQAEPAEPAQGRPVRTGRGVDGGCRPGPPILPCRPLQCLRHPGRRRGSASLGRPWHRPGRLDCFGRGAGRASDRNLPPGRRERDRHRRLCHQPGSDAELEGSRRA